MSHFQLTVAQQQLLDCIRLEFAKTNTTDWIGTKNLPIKKIRPETLHALVDAGFINCRRICLKHNVDMSIQENLPVPDIELEVQLSFDGQSFFEWWVHSEATNAAYGEHRLRNGINYLVKKISPIV